MRKTFVRFFTIADYEEEETWLREKNKEGWKLVKMIPPCFFVFEECEPEDVIYRLDFKNNTQTESYLQMLSDFGWEYCGKCLGWLYFRKPAADAGTLADGELFSDNASRAEMAVHVARTRLIPLTIIFLCCVLPNFARILDGRHVGFYGKFFTVFFGVMFFLYLFLIIYCGAKLTRIRKKYSN